MSKSLHPPVVTGVSWLQEHFPLKYLDLQLESQPTIKMCFVACDKNKIPFSELQGLFSGEILKRFAIFSAKYTIEIGLLGKKLIAKCNLDKDFAKTFAENS